jgi:predicted secreted protein
LDEVLVADASRRFVVELEEPAATGYSWMPVVLPAGIQLESDEVTPAEAVVGGIRHHLFRLVASQAGRYQLDFELKRAWEEQAAEARHVQVEVGT